MRRTRIVVLGDSISYGAFDHIKGGWVNRLREVMPMHKFELYNCSVSGAKIKHLIHRAEIELVHRRPDIVVYSIGINDAQDCGMGKVMHVALANFKHGLEILLNIANKFTNKVVFVGLTPVDESKTLPCEWNVRKFYAEDTVRQYNMTLKSFCNRNAVAFVDVFDKIHKFDLADGLHLTSRGHITVADEVCNTLLKKFGFRYKRGTLSYGEEKEESSE